MGKKDLEIKVRIRNNLILMRIKEVYPMCRTLVSFVIMSGYGLSGRSSLSGYLNFRLSPLSKCGEWYLSALKLASVLRCSPEDIFPGYLVEPRQNVFEITVENRGLYLDAMSGQPNPSQLLIDEETENIMTDAMAALSDRIGIMLNMRYGIGDNMRCHTYREIGSKFGISGSRVSQLLEKAKSKLRGSLLLMGVEPELVSA